MSEQFYDIEIPELLPFKNDYIFKTALTKPNAGIVRNAMLSAFTGLEIVESTVSENEPPIVLSSLEKPIRLDVNCKTADGKQINIEMQTKAMEADNISNQHISLCNRTIFYEHKLFASQESPKLYCDFKQTFQITICDFTVFPDKKFLHKFTFCDGEIQLSDISNVIFLELSKIKKLLNSPVENLTAEEQWAVFIEFFGNKNFYTKIPEFENKEEFKMANDILSSISKNDKERFAYMSYLKFQSDLEHNQNAAEARGRAEGKAEGKAEGLAEGEAKGKVEGMFQKAIETAKNLLSFGVDKSVIAKSTGLSEEEISKLSS